MMFELTDRHLNPLPTNQPAQIKHTMMRRKYQSDDGDDDDEHREREDTTQGHFRPYS